MSKLDLGPRNADELAVFAVEELRADIQYEILRAMDREGVTQAELAKRLGCSAAAVSQFLDDDANLTVESVAKLFLALNCQCSVSSRPIAEHLDAAEFSSSATSNEWHYEPIEVAPRSFIDTEALLSSIRLGRRSKRRDFWANDNGQFQDDLEQVA